MTELVECLTCKKTEKETYLNECPFCGSHFCDFCPRFCDCTVIRALAEVEMQLDTDY